MKIFKNFKSIQLIYLIITLSLILVTSCSKDVQDLKEIRFEYFKNDNYISNNAIKCNYIEYSSFENNYLVLENSDIDSRISPCSTFKIVNSLVALDENLVSQTDSKKSWNESKYPYESWNKDQTMESAFKNSVVWYYQDLARQIGSKTMKSYLEELQYGNTDISGGIDKFWLASTLSIAPKEQVDIMSKIFVEGKFFEEDSINYVEEIMFIGDFNGIKIYGKTGSSNTSSIGWFVGFYDIGDKRNTFATYLESDTENAKVSGDLAKEIAIYTITCCNKRYE